jgi:hypothetical protein
MVKGHMNHIRQHIRSTQPTVADPTPQIYTYLTGRFQKTSLSVIKYISILCYYDSNRILSAPMKDRGEKEMVRAFDLLIQSLVIRGLRPSL